MVSKLLMNCVFVQTICLPPLHLLKFFTNCLLFLTGVLHSLHIGMEKVIPPSGIHSLQIILYDITNNSIPVSPLMLVP